MILIVLSSELKKDRADYATQTLISLQHGVETIKFYKLRLFYLAVLKVWKIKGLQRQVAKI